MIDKKERNALYAALQHKESELIHNKAGTKKLTVNYYEEAMRKEDQEKADAIRIWNIVLMNIV